MYRGVEVQLHHSGTRHQMQASGQSEIIFCWAWSLVCKSLASLVSLLSSRVKYIFRILLFCFWVD
jgi:hypothetical protein